MPYALDTNDGVFVGCAFGLAFTAGSDSVGQVRVPVVQTRAEADQWEAEMRILCPQLEPRAVEVVSGHWRDLLAAGLFVGDMPANELGHAPDPTTIN